MTDEYQYEFANGDVSVLHIPDDWCALLRELDRQEANNNQTEHRRHCSLEEYNRYDSQFPLPHDAYEQIEERDTWEDMRKHLTEQEALVGDLYFRKGYLQQDLACCLCLSQSRIAQIIIGIQEKLQRRFYNY